MNENVEVEIALINKDDAISLLEEAVMYIKVAKSFTKIEYRDHLALAALDYIKKAEKIIKKKFDLL